MALYVFPTTTFKPSSSASCEVGIAGEAIAVGDALYRDSTTSKWYLSDANGAAAKQTVEGMAATASGADGCRIVVCRTDDALDTGATTTQVMALGDILVLSATPGKLQPAPADSGSKSIVVALANTATQMKLVLKAGSAVP